MQYAIIASYDHENNLSRVSLQDPGYNEIASFETIELAVEYCEQNEIRYEVLDDEL